MAGFKGPVDKRRDEEILRLISEGKSYSVVAEMLDLRNSKGEISRSIVSGAIFRARQRGDYETPADQHFSHKKRPLDDTKYLDGQRKRRETVKRGIPLDRMHPIAREREIAHIKAMQDEAKVQSEAPVVPEALTFLELRASHCRRPLGKWNEKAEFFCGKPRMDVKTPYCALCHRVMYMRTGPINLWTTRGRAA